MRKAKGLLLMAIMAVSITACGGNTTTATTAATTTAATTAAATTAAETTAAATTAAETTAAATEAETTAASSESIVTTGELDTSLFGAPILVTSFGQSTDAAMLDTVMKKLGVEYTYNATATADDIGSSKTVVICVGASTKGLGAAGISEAEETERAEAFMEAIKGTDAKIVLCHIGGSARRGGLSDSFSDMVIDVADYMVVKADGNEDGKFSTAAEGAGVPITVIQSTKDTIEVFTSLFTE